MIEKRTFSLDEESCKILDACPQNERSAFVRRALLAFDSGVVNPSFGSVAVSSSDDPFEAECARRVRVISLVKAFYRGRDSWSFENVAWDGKDNRVRGPTFSEFRNFVTDPDVLSYSVMDKVFSSLPVCSAFVQKERDGDTSVEKDGDASFIFNLTLADFLWRNLSNTLVGEEEIDVRGMLVDLFLVLSDDVLRGLRVGILTPSSQNNSNE